MPIFARALVQRASGATWYAVEAERSKEKIIARTSDGNAEIDAHKFFAPSWALPNYLDIPPNRNNPLLLQRNSSSSTRPA